MKTIKLFTILMIILSCEPDPCTTGATVRTSYDVKHEKTYNKNCTNDILFNIRSSPLLNKIKVEPLGYILDCEENLNSRWRLLNSTGYELWITWEIMETEISGTVNLKSNEEIIFSSHIENDKKEHTFKALSSYQDGSFFEFYIDEMAQKTKVKDIKKCKGCDYFERVTNVEDQKVKCEECGSFYHSKNGVETIIYCD